MQITLTYHNPYQAHVYTHIQEIYDFKSVSNEQRYQFRRFYNLPN